MSFKVGDIVIISSAYTPSKLGKIEKITPSGFIKVDGVLYKANGEVGFQRGADAFSRKMITVASEKDIQTIKEEKEIRKCLYKMARVKMDEINYEQAYQINQIMCW